MSSPSWARGKTDWNALRATIRQAPSERVSVSKLCKEVETALVQNRDNVRLPGVFSLENKRRTSGARFLASAHGDLTQLRSRRCAGSRVFQHVLPQPPGVHLLPTRHQQCAWDAPVWMARLRVTVGTFSARSCHSLCTGSASPPALRVFLVGAPSLGLAQQAFPCAFPCCRAARRMPRPSSSSSPRPAS